MRVAISGIPSANMRHVVGRGADHTALYTEMRSRVASEKNLQHEIGRIANTGNYLIGEGVRYALTGCEGQYVPQPWLVGSHGPELIDHVNRNFDFFVFCTANIFHVGNDPAELAWMIDQIRIPILMTSAGIQRRTDFAETCPEHFLPLIEVLRRKNVHMFTRGTATAEFLQSQGIKRVEPVGCPSLYAFPDNMRESFQRLKRLDVDNLGDVVYSGYLGSVKDTIADINGLVSPGGHARYVVQDEPLLFNYTFEGAENARIYNDTSGEIVAPVDFPGRDALDVPLRHYVFFSTEQWRAFSSRSDFAFARRFHGGVIAAQTGVPAFWLAVDDRTAEMLEFAELPHLKAADWNGTSDKRAQLRNFVGQFDLERSLRTYNTRLERFRALLKGLGLRK